MGFFSLQSPEAKAADFVQQTDYFGPEYEHQLSHELIGAAAAFEAAKTYEEYVADTGKPDSHARAKELLAGFASNSVDRIAETKGEDFYDREQAKRIALHQVEQAYDENN